MDFKTTLASHLFALLGKDPVLARLLGQDHGISLTITGDLRGGTLTVIPKDPVLDAVDTALATEIRLPLFVGLRGADPSHLTAMHGVLTLTGSDGVYTFTVTLV